MATDTFSERCLIGITKSGGSEFQFAPITVYDSIDIDEGDNEKTYAATAAGGRLGTAVPRGDTVITLEMKPVGISALASYEGLSEWFYGTAATAAYSGGTPDSGVKVQNTGVQSKFRLVLTWTTDPSASTASGALATGYDHWRYIAVNADLVSLKLNNTGDGSLVCTAKFRVTPFGKAGNSQPAIKVQSTYGALVVLGTTWTGTYH